jgi:hypothetical protein
MSVRNTGTETVRFQLPQLTVLEPISSAYAPIVVESNRGWEMPPGTDFKARLIGYSLDQSKSGVPRGQDADYTTVADTEYARAQFALKKSLEYERSEGFQASLLSEDKHRTLVIQRLIWTVYGSRNPKTPQALVEDLSRRFDRAGENVNAKTVQALAASIWRDVAKVHETLR